MFAQCENRSAETMPRMASVQKGCQKGNSNWGERRKRHSKKILKSLSCLTCGPQIKQKSAQCSLAPHLWIVSRARRLRDASNSLWNVRKSAGCRKGCWLIAGTVAHRTTQCTQIWSVGAQSKCRCLARFHSHSHSHFHSHSQSRCHFRCKSVTMFNYSCTSEF